jgi:hypothetical protein
MGKRSRKRPIAPGQTRREAPVPAPPPKPVPSVSRRARLDEAPKAPWSPFPLVELCILGGLVLLVIGFVGARALFVFCGVALVGVASLELAIREHFAGYRSHSSLLAMASAIATMALLGIGIGVTRIAAVIAGIAVFAAALLALRAAFRKKTGGVSFRA